MAAVRGRIDLAELVRSRYNDIYLTPKNKVRATEEDIHAHTCKYI